MKGWLLVGTLVMAIGVGSGCGDDDGAAGETAPTEDVGQTPLDDVTVDDVEDTAGPTDGCLDPPCEDVEVTPDVAPPPGDGGGQMPDTSTPDPEDTTEDPEEVEEDPCLADPCAGLPQPEPGCIDNSTAHYAPVADCQVGEASLGEVSEILEQRCSGCHGNDNCTVFNACFLNDTGDMWHPPANLNACGDYATVAECAVARMINQSMPPGNNPKVLPEDAALLQVWIDQNMSNTVAIGEGVLCQFEVLESTDCTAQVLTCDAGACVPPDLTVEQSPIIDGQESADGMVNITVIDGNLTIAASDLGDLAFPYLKEVKGSIFIDFAAGVTSVSFPALEVLGNQLHVEGNDDLVSVSLPALTSAGKALFLSDNPALDALDLGALSTLGGDLTLQNLAALEDASLPLLTSLGGKLVAQGNGALTDLTFNQLSTTGGSLQVYGNPSLKTLGLSSLTTVAGKLRVAGQPVMPSLGLDVLTQVLGAVEIHDLGNLNYLSLSALETVTGEVSLEQLPKLALLTLNSLGSVGGDLEIEGCPALTSLGGHFQVQQADQITKIYTMALPAVGGDFRITNAPALKTVLAGDLVTVGGAFVVSANPDLSTLDVELLETVGGELTLSESNLTEVGLHGLTEIAGNVSVAENPGLTSFRASSLTSIAGALSIYGNPELEVLEMPELVSVTSVTVGNNPKLPGCLVDALVADMGQVPTTVQNTIAGCECEAQEAPEGPADDDEEPPLAYQVTCP